MKPSPRRSWIRPAISVLTIVVSIAILAGLTFTAIGIWMGNNRTDGEHVSAEDIARNDEELRSKPSYETTVKQLDVTLIETSDALAEAFPYLEFQWKRDPTFLTCEGSSAYSKLSASRVADKPIAEDDWDRAFQIVVDHVSILGPVETGAFHDKPGMRDTAISAGGFTINFASVKATVLSGDTPCRLPQSVIDQAP